jgi:hypothetical protein
MKKTVLINPTGLKGNEINERMKELMGIKPINENKSSVVVELTKKGPDGNSYAVIRENHEWYIKKTSKTNNLVAEDFQYIGGLKNKKLEAYPSYAQAIKHLNLKFRSLAEAYNYNGEINLFLNDNLLTESGVAGFSSEGNGFTNNGNLEVNEEIEEMIEEEIEMTEAEIAIDNMLKEESDDLPETPSEEETSKNQVYEGRLSIESGLKNLDSIIDAITEGLKKKA